MVVAWPVADSFLDAAVTQVGFSTSPRGGCKLLQKLARCASVQEGLLQPLALLEGGLLQPLALLEWEPPQIHE